MHVLEAVFIADSCDTFESRLVNRHKQIAPRAWKIMPYLSNLAERCKTSFLLHSPWRSQRHHCFSSLLSEVKNVTLLCSWLSIAQATLYRGLLELRHSCLVVIQVIGDEAVRWTAQKQMLKEAAEKIWCQSPVHVLGSKWTEALKCNSGLPCLST